MRIYDSVHGFIHFNELEKALIDTEAFQRLHYIHQLGIAYHIYPGGTHTRFEHSLGTMYLAHLIFEHIGAEEDKAFWRQMVRFAALCHDLGHLPFSHVAERWLLGPGGHEEWTLKIIESKGLAPVWEQAQAMYPGKNIPEAVAKLSLGQEKFSALRPGVPFTPLEQIYSLIITGDFFGADRMDYLLRDAQATGLSYGLFDYAQLIEMLKVVEGEGGKLQIGVEENGVESCEALLLSRYFMHRKVYKHPAIKAFSFHLARFMELFYRDSSRFDSVENYLELSEYEILCALQQARKDPTHPGHLDAVCVFDRKKRFVATHLPETITLSDLQTFQKKAHVLPTHIHWELAQKKSFFVPFALPIVRKNGELVPASSFSDLQIPAEKKSWLYLAPEYSFPL